MIRLFFIREFTGISVCDAAGSALSGDIRVHKRHVQCVFRKHSLDLPRPLDTDEFGCILKDIAESEHFHFRDRFDAVCIYVHQFSE